MCEEQQDMPTKYGWRNYFLTVLFAFGVYVSFSHIYWEAKYFTGILFFYSPFSECFTLTVLA